MTMGYAIQKKDNSSAISDIESLTRELKEAILDAGLETDRELVEMANEMESIVDNNDGDDGAVRRAAEQITAYLENNHRGRSATLDDVSDAFKICAKEIEVSEDENSPCGCGDIPF